MKNEIFFVHKRDIFLCYNYFKMLRTKDACQTAACAASLYWHHYNEADEKEQIQEEIKWMV